MASRPISPEQMLAAIPSLPRPMLTRLVDQMIDRLDELDGDADEEDNGDAEPIDEREAEEEYGLVAGSPLSRPRPSALSRHCVDTIPARWHLSISTDRDLLSILTV
jgi:hypothetical protein